MSTKPDDQKFIKRDEAESVKNAEEVVEVIDDLSGSEIKPKNNQQRNLDRETGGVEAQSDKQTTEVGGFEDWQENQKSKKDAWDDRSKEVDLMGSHNPLGTSAKKSMIWRNKKKKMDEKKMLEAAAESLVAGTAVKSSSQGYNSANPQQSFVSNLKNLKQDRSSINDSRGGGMGR